MRILYRPIVSLAFFSLISTAAADHLTTDQVIDQTVTLMYVASGAEDVSAELEKTVTSFLRDTSAYTDLIADMALTIPILRGMSADPSLRADSVSARLRHEVTDHVLKDKKGWDDRRVWRNLYAVWAYACHADDWTVVRDNWAFVRARYVASTAGRAAIPVSNEQIYGQFAFARMAGHQNDSLAKPARIRAANGLTMLLDRVDSARSTHAGWSPGLDIGADIGRWIGDQRRDAAGDCIGGLVHAAGAANRWWCPDSGVIDKRESARNRPAEIFLAKAWIMHDPGVKLRPVRPCRESKIVPRPHRDAAYLRIVQTFILKYSAVRWNRSW
jgi:hypothetical protein